MADIAKLVIKSGVTIEESALKNVQGDSSGGWAPISEEWAINPDTGVAWTWADIANLQAGISLTGEEEGAQCTQVYVEIDYTEAGEVGKSFAQII